MHDPSDFYLASAAVIPIMALVQAVQRTLILRPESEQAEASLKFMLKTARLANVLWTAAEAGFFIWAEFICLRWLEVGHAPLGGSGFVWAALLYGAVYLTMLRLSGLIEEDDIHKFVAWSERRGWLVQPRRRRPNAPDE